MAIHLDAHSHNGPPQRLDCLLHHFRLIPGTAPSGQSTTADPTGSGDTERLFAAIVISFVVVLLLVRLVLDFRSDISKAIVFVLVALALVGAWAYFLAEKPPPYEEPETYDRYTQIVDSLNRISEARERDLEARAEYYRKELDRLRSEPIDKTPPATTFGDAFYYLDSVLSRSSGAQVFDLEDRTFYCMNEVRTVLLANNRISLEDSLRHFLSAYQTAEQLNHVVDSTLAERTRRMDRNAIRLELCESALSKYESRLEIEQRHTLAQRRGKRFWRGMTIVMSALLAVDYVVSRQ